MEPASPGASESDSPGVSMPPRRGCLSFVAFAVCGVVLVLDCLGYLGPEDFEPSPLSSEAADLGMVLLPPGIPPTQVQTYTWRVEGLEPRWHRVIYGLDTSLVDKIERDEEALGKRMHFRAISRERFTFRAPRECEVDMRCVYEELMRTNSEPVKQLGHRFLAYIRDHQLSSEQAADLIIGFVQRIHYELPPVEVPFGVIPPALVPAKDSGDCDSKALLAVMLLQQAGIDAVLLYSDRLAHAAVGVGLPGSGTALRREGRSWRYAEVTAEGWPIGMIPPQYDKPQLWTVIPPFSQGS
ncbi:hypothetical protein [Hyalangium versicolor]|uniref:hypothetical protein n=1 Tax=Hyalangium versicolor TaxID=2861190 RepID=UPI001CCB1F69|nr:hypothetical protein [Hyalangium versicolor]